MTTSSECCISRVGVRVRDACIDDIARSYAVEAEECLKKRATDAHRHKCGRRPDSTPSFLAAIASSCMISSESSLWKSNSRRVNRHEISASSARGRCIDEFAVLRLSRPAEIAMLRYSISLVHRKAR